MPTAPTAIPHDLAGRVVVVTGAGPGSIGLATARALADWGAEVVVTTRSVPVEASPGGPSAWHPLDLADRTSVAEFATWLLDRYADRLDVLVNNAGIHLDLRSTMDRAAAGRRPRGALADQLPRDGPADPAAAPGAAGSGERTGEARIVHVVSKLHRRGTNAAMFDGLEPYNSWAAYGTSKLALVHDAGELYRRHGEAGLRAMSLHPGSVYTRVADRGLETSPVLGRLRALAAPLERRVLMTPEQGAQTTLHCVADPGARHGYFRGCAPAEPATEALDVVAAKRLWDRTEAWLAEAGA